MTRRLETVAYGALTTSPASQSAFVDGRPNVPVGAWGAEQFPGAWTSWTPQGRPTCAVAEETFTLFVMRRLCLSVPLLRTPSGPPASRRLTGGRLARRARETRARQPPRRRRSARRPFSSMVTGCRRQRLQIESEESVFPDPDCSAEITLRSFPPARRDGAHPSRWPPPQTTTSGPASAAPRRRRTEARPSGASPAF